MTNSHALRMKLPGLLTDVMNYKKKRLILALDFSKSVCHAQTRPLEFNDCFLGVGAHNAGGLQFEISDPDASFGLRRRKTDRGHRGATARDRKD